MEQKSVRELIADLAQVEDGLRSTAHLPAVVDEGTTVLRLEANDIVFELRRRQAALRRSG